MLLSALVKGFSVYRKRDFLDYVLSKSFPAGWKKNAQSQKAFLLFGNNKSMNSCWEIFGNSRSCLDKVLCPLRQCASRFPQNMFLD